MATDFHGGGGGGGNQNLWREHRISRELDLRPKHIGYKASRAFQGLPCNLRPF